jgi:hypothetical protein
MLEKRTPRENNLKTHPLVKNKKHWIPYKCCEIMKESKEHVE